jgi:hypothetical protein
MASLWPISIYMFQYWTVHCTRSLRVLEWSWVHGSIISYPYVTSTRTFVGESKEDLGLLKHRATRTNRGGGSYLHTFFTSALDAGQWWPSRPGHFTAGKEALGNRWIEGWLGPRASMDAVNRITWPAINPYSSAMQSVARGYTEWGIPAPSFGESDGNKFIYGKFVWLQPGNAAYS